MNREIRIAALLAACTTLLLFPAGAARIDFTPSAVTVPKSATANISLVLDEAPSGLAGYNLVILSSNPGVARNKRGQLSFLGIALQHHQEF